jgi:hypothetical protein
MSIATLTYSEEIIYNYKQVKETSKIRSKTLEFEYGKKQQNM